MLVADASAFTELAVGGPRAAAVAREMRGRHVVVPELFDAEVANALKGAERSGRIGRAVAVEGMVSLVRAPIRRIRHRELLPDAWALRHTLSTYDAFYVALARRLNAPVVTCDQRWAAAGDLGVTVITVG